MKKILLGLFLGLTSLSFSAPSFVNVKEIERKNYNIIADIDEVLSYYKIFEDGAVETVTHVYDKNSSAKDINDMFKTEIINENVESQDSFETKKHYISKYYDSSEEMYIYLITGKNSKVKNGYTSILYVTELNLNKENLESKANIFFNEAESYLKK
ncbi:hypothetical protein [Leptotrichia hongkongensis]|jgi:hypothetical protein|uniref:hypothetical protein n=1 Tax=Leptotrichia hongkongensis TaxID=554406 RepID=UPI0035A9A3A2